MCRRIAYCVPEQRELSGEERALLHFLLEKEAPERLHEIDSLHVVARCGCGKCPTILFGSARDSEPDTSHPFEELLNYIGSAPDNTLVGVVLIERKGKLSELEAWSPEGNDILSWPQLESLQRLDEYGPTELL